MLMLPRFSGSSNKLAAGVTAGRDLVNGNYNELCGDELRYALIEFSSKQATRPDDCLHIESLRYLWVRLPNAPYAWALFPIPGTWYRLHVGLMSRVI